VSALPNELLCRTIDSKKCDKLLKRIENYDKELQTIKDTKKELDQHLKDLYELLSKIGTTTA
jgi:chaperonin cofactor prefoldin